MIAALMDWWPWLAALGGLGVSVWLFPVLLLDKRAWLAVLLVGGALYMRHHGIKTERVRHEALVEELNAREAAHEAAAKAARAANAVIEAEAKTRVAKIEKENQNAIAKIKGEKSRDVDRLVHELVAARGLLRESAPAGSCATASEAADPGAAEKTDPAGSDGGAQKLAAAAIAELAKVSKAFAETREDLITCRAHVGVE